MDTYDIIENKKIEVDRMKDYFTYSYDFYKRHPVRYFFHKIRCHFKKVNKKDLMSLVEFQKWQEKNPIEADIRYIERLHEVFE